MPTLPALLTGGEFSLALASVLAMMILQMEISRQI